MPKRSAKATENIDAKKPKSIDWATLDGVVVKEFGDKTHGNVVFGFDMDSTLITTKSGAKFAKDADDWQLWHTSVPDVLHKKLAEHGPHARVVIVTNQGGVEKGKTNLADITDKIDALVEHLKIPSAVAFIVTTSGFYRKPAPGSWDLFCQKYNGGAPDMEKSVYVGDAAGRPKIGKRKADFSDSDLKFALNIGLPFMTPEQFFFHERAEKQEVPTSFTFDPRTLGATKTPLSFGPSEKLEVMILVGAPAAGKSMLASTVFESYMRINRDTLKTKDKCVSAAEEALQNKRSVVIDNQNVKASDRAPYVALAKKYGAEVRAVVLEVPKHFCFHANTYREFTSSNRDKVPSMIIHSYYKNVEKPTETECSEIFTYTLDNFEVQNGHERIQLFLV